MLNIPRNTPPGTRRGGTAALPRYAARGNLPGRDDTVKLEIFPAVIIVAATVVVLAITGL